MKKVEQLAVRVPLQKRPIIFGAVRDAQILRLLC